MSQRRRRGSRGRNRVPDQQLQHLPLPTDPEELTPAQLAWVRLVLKQLPPIRPVSADDCVFSAGDPTTDPTTIFADRENGTTGLPRPWFHKEAP